LYNYDFEIEKPDSGWKITWQMFDRIPPAMGGIISWFVLVLIINFIPYRLNNFNDHDPATLIQAVTLTMTLALMLAIPTIFFGKGILQGRELILCVFGMVISGFLNLFNVVRLERAIDYFFISQTIPIIG
jgi:hypothetical protein